MHYKPHIFLLLAACLVEARPWVRPSSRAVYILTNNEANAIIGHPVYSNGLLGKGQVTLTGGSGQNGLNANLEPAGPDALFSQGALAVAGEYLFAVNAGSNTLSMLKADERDPSKLTLIGQPAVIPGDFPTSVAAAAKGQLVCVGTTGTRAGISCTTFGKHGLGVMDALRPFGISQTTPPTGPANTLSQVFFSADETALFATVKGVPNTDNTGFFSVFSVEYGHHKNKGIYLGTQDIRSSPNGTMLLFGSATIPHSRRVFVTDPSFGVAMLDVDHQTHEAALVSRAVIPGQRATCWAAYSARRHSVFVTDVAVNRLVELNADDSSISLIADLPNGDPGLVDLQVVDNHVYALSPGNGTTEAAITVFDSGRQKQVQHVTLSAQGANRNAMGMAFIDTRCWNCHRPLHG